MGALTVVMGVMIGMSGWRKYRMFRKPAEPLSFQESLAIGVVTGVIVFPLHTFNKVALL
jgi:hypothetical protein